MRQGDQQYNPKEELKYMRGINQRKRYVYWSDQQNSLYYQFLKGIESSLWKDFSRNKQILFKRMSKFIKSKSSLQCRSHHQKMMQKFRTIQGIIEHCSILRSQIRKNEQQYNFQAVSRTNSNQIDREKSPIFNIISNSHQEKQNSQNQYSQSSKIKEMRLDKFYGHNCESNQIINEWDYD